MAKNDRDRLIEKFLSRSRNTRAVKAGLTPGPNITGTMSPYRPLKRSARKPTKRPARY